MVWFTTETVGADCFRSYNGPAVVQLHPSFLEKLKDKKKTKKQRILPGHHRILPCTQFP